LWPPRTDEDPTGLKQRAGVPDQRLTQDSVELRLLETI
jgi:hypothetical protein